MPNHLKKVICVIQSNSLRSIAIVSLMLFVFPKFVSLQMMPLCVLWAAVSTRGSIVGLAVHLSLIQLLQKHMSFLVHSQQVTSLQYGVKSL